MAVALTMAAMKVAALRHALRGQRAQTAVTGAVLGAVLAGGTLYLAFGDLDLLAAAYAVWLLGWLLGPVFMGGGDETLRPEYFALLGLPARTMAFGLLVAAFVGLAPLISLVALVGLVIAGVRLGVGNALVAVPALVLQLAVFVLLSKVGVALVGLALRSRLGAIATGVVNGAILAGLGQIWVVFWALGQTGIPSVVWYLPSGWGLLAVRGTWWALPALAGLVLVLLAAWAGLLSWRVGATRVSFAGRRRPITAASSSGAVVAKELRAWSRDLVRNYQVTFALAYGVCFAASPLLLSWDGMLPYAGPIFLVMAAAMSANVYGTDGTALWLNLLTPGGSDVRGRQWAWLVVHAPPAVVVTLVCTAVAGGPWPMVLSLLPALLGGAVGLVPLISVYGLVPGTDPHRRANNPLRTSEDDGGLTGQAYAALALVAATAVPAALAAHWFGWAGPVIGVLTGLSCYRGFGALAARRLRTHGVELLQEMRTGRRAAGSRSVRTRFAALPAGRQAVAWVCFGLGAIPLIPQGVLAAVFVSRNMLRHSWFVATYMSPGLRYPVAIAFMVLGATMYAVGTWLVRPTSAKVAG
ncbi:hypothetical protein [Asanoa siamensis]|uniref:ABC-2 type transport system permease protein n=1 Tax=Asanoa siamensis TaxID=926357 RepID=A0ABQ4CLL5_9ACTN|nr:hypothetical protein [Asanoa siamensis]GIF72191.1 hypothetical protein Asi02nite_17090 [Asanoa siamensis]